MDILSPSNIVCQALNIDPDGATHSKIESRCGMCGGDIVKGDPVSPLRFPSSFTMYRQLFDNSAPYRCGYCQVLYEGKPFLLDLATGIYCAEGYFPIAKKVNRGWAFTDPPAVPFVMSIQVNRSQHMLWRSPVCYSRELMTFQRGEERLTVRRSALAVAAATGKRIQSTWLNQQPESRKTADKKLPPPLGFSDLKGAAREIGEIQRWVHKLHDDCLIPDDDIAPLRHLNLAEAWALDSMLGEIEKPEPITSLDQYQSSKTSTN